MNAILSATAAAPDSLPSAAVAGPASLPSAAVAGPASLPSAAVAGPAPLPPAAAAGPASLPSPALARRLADLCGEERNVQVEFLLHLDVFDRRRAWAEAGYGSLWAYCLEVLHLRESAAGRRIGAMKLLRRFPSLEGALRDGRLCLSTVNRLGRILTDENFADLVVKYGVVPREAMAETASSTKFVRATLDTNRKERDARRLHSMTLLSWARARNWMLKGPVMRSARAITRPISRMRRMVSM